MIYLSLPNLHVKKKDSVNPLDGITQYGKHPVRRQEGHHVSTGGSTERPKHTRHTGPSNPHDFNVTLHLSRPSQTGFFVVTCSGIQMYPKK